MTPVPHEMYNCLLECLEELCPRERVDHYALYRRICKSIGIKSNNDIRQLMNGEVCLSMVSEDEWKGMTSGQDIES